MEKNFTQLDDAQLHTSQRGDRGTQRNREKQYLSCSIDVNDSKAADQIKFVSEMLMALPSSFSGTLKMLMKWKHISIEELEEHSMISARTINRLRLEEKDSYSIDQVIALCIGLQLSPEFSEDLIRKAGIQLRFTPKHLLYRNILRTMYREPLTKIQALLAEQSFSALKLRET